MFIDPWKISSESDLSQLTWWHTYRYEVSRKVWHVKYTRISRIFRIEPRYKGTEDSKYACSAARFIGYTMYVSAMSTIAKNKLGPKFSFNSKNAAVSGTITVRVRTDWSIVWDWARAKVSWMSQVKFTVELIIIRSRAQSGNVGFSTWRPANAADDALRDSGTIGATDFAWAPDCTGTVILAHDSRATGASKNARKSRTIKLG